MASNEELTSQIVSLNATIRALQERLGLAENEIVRGQAARAGTGGGGNREDEKRLYPDSLSEKSSFKEFGEDFMDWIEDRSDELHAALESAMSSKIEGCVEPWTPKKEEKKYYRLLKKLVKGHAEARQVVKNTPNANFLEAWRRISRRFDPQTDGIHTLQLRSILGFLQ